MKLYQPILLLGLSFGILACEESGKNDIAHCVLDGTWHLTVTRVETSDCALNNCGHSSYPNCSEISLLEIQTQEEKIQLEPMIAGLLSGQYFKGNIQDDEILAIHETQFDSELKARVNSNCSLDAEILWNPTGSCLATIEFRANK